MKHTKWHICGAPAAALSHQVVHLETKKTPGNERTAHTVWAGGRTLTWSLGRTILLAGMGPRGRSFGGKFFISSTCLCRTSVALW